MISPVPKMELLGKKDEPQRHKDTERKEIF
jgi:hypothetical protein